MIRSCGATKIFLGVIGRISLLNNTPYGGLEGLEINQQSDILKFFSYLGMSASVSNGSILDWKVLMFAHLQLLIVTKALPREYLEHF